MAFQPQPNSDTRCPDSVHPALPGRLYFLCHDSIHCHPQPRNVHAAVRVHLRAAAVPLRHFMAGSCYARFLEVLLVHLPSTFGINGYVRINSMGATLNEVSFEYQALWIQTGFYFITTCLVYRWQILQSRKHVIEEYKKHKSIEA